MKKFQEIREAANAAQQAAIAIAKKEKGEKPKNEQKVECPECEGEGCDHCDGKGYHMKMLDENVLKKVGSAMKKVASPVTNRLTRAGRAGIAQKKIDKHNTKVSQQDTIKKANDAGKSAFGFTRKQRAANAQKKLDKLAKKKAQQDTINRAKNLQKGVSAGMTYESTLEEKFTPKQIKMAVGVASDPRYKRGNMTGAVKAIEKIAKGLSNEKQVAAVLKKQNEGKKMDPAAMKRAMDAFKKRGGKIKKVAPGKAAGYHGKDDPGAGVHGMMDRGDTKGMPRKKKIGSMK